jgi:hypothetical protein
MSSPGDEVVVLCSNMHAVELGIVVFLHFVPGTLWGS